ncbi:MAG: N-acetylmuramoyl-L-alanine amidase [Gammaproteobacteria bacterium]|nr:N-acetylmuramoyl-L-alanine amidase [Gammaproteobacteria bacterium]
MADRLSTRAIVVHCSATRAAQDVGVAEIRGWHLTRGFSDIGYAVVIRRSGVIEMGRPIPAVGAHVQGRNHDTVGVCLVGGLDEQGAPEMNYTPGQWAALSIAIKFLRATYPSAEVVGHRDLSPDLNQDGKITPNEWLKACPCFDVRAWVRELMPVTGPAKAA